MTDFSNFNVGSINGQSGWTTQADFSQCQTVLTFDEAIVNVSGKKVGRVSNSIIHSQLSAQPFSPTTTDVAGESGAALWLAT